jgi:hypothetical protein
MCISMPNMYTHVRAYVYTRASIHTMLMHLARQDLYYNNKKRINSKPPHTHSTCSVSLSRVRACTRTHTHTQTHTHTLTSAHNAHACSLALTHARQD